MGKSTKSPRTGGRLDEPEGGYSAWRIDRWCSCRIRLDWSRTVFRGQVRLSECKLRERRRSCQRAFRARSVEAGGTRLQRRTHAHLDADGSTGEHYVSRFVPFHSPFYACTYIRSLRIVLELGAPW